MTGRRKIDVQGRSNMSRELNPQLFSEPRLNNMPASSDASALGSTKLQVSNEEWALILAQIEHLKRKITDHDSKLEVFNSKIQELVGGLKIRFERLISGQQRLDEQVRLSVHDLATKYAQLAGKLNEKKNSDSKIQDLIDRHTQLVHGFETRLLQLQKIISEQELQLMTSRAELKEAQKELMKLKRF